MQFLALSIFHLTYLTFRPQTGQRGSAQWASSALRAFQLTSLQVCDSQKLFWRLILIV